MVIRRRRIVLGLRLEIDMICGWDRDVYSLMTFA
jgi:hypothetical protein